MKIFESSFMTTEFNSEIGIFINRWSPHEMEENDFMDIMSEVAKLTTEYRPHGILVDTRQFTFTINPELQEWYAKEIVPVHLKSGVNYMAFLMSADFIAQLSIEQTLEEESDYRESQTTRYFSEESEALAWLKSIKPISA